MTDEQLLRYARHLNLDDIGIDGQEKLLKARVLIAGLGGLGSPVGMYLAASGIGQLDLVDFDTVELSNLQRQIIHTTEYIGWSKVQSAAHTIASLNPEVRCYLHTQKPNSLADWLSLIQSVDLVLDCTDNYPTRQMINQACVELRKPLVSAAAIRYMGNIFMYNPFKPESACYACLFDEMEQVQTDRCATMGVLSPLLGVMGSMQSIVAINYLTQGRDLNNRMLMLDAKTLTWQTLMIPKREHCSICSKPTK
ncbi:hypothetical protein IX83_01060 [Basilea psittacipulmonis DSM 24701]|uniref:Molybdopterin-synthase adenylyltransferase n=3 Tax=Basilea TaxID=1472344 RepID=A0A077DG08_9BURK|nr:hypothetical protein IX83_01060 [Basilea psittacipulmonis DSM 24701]